MRKLNALLAGVLVALSTAASAATITISWNSPAFSPSGVNVGTINFPVNQTTGADAGRFEGTATAWSGIDPNTFYASTTDFYAYCFDLAQTLQSGAVYTVIPGAPTVVLDFLGAANAYFGGNAFRWLTPANSNEAAAVQLGIWEALFNDDFVLNAGNVRFQTVNATVANIFSGIVALRASTADLGAQFVMQLHSDTRQDVITGVRPTLRIPEPGSLALAGLAAAIAGLAKRRR
jgi:hypothetical protein